MQKAWGYGKDCKYPHNEPESWTEQQYLPNDLQGRRFYFPRSNGEEENVTEWWRTLHNVPLDEEKK